MKKLAVLLASAASFCLLAAPAVAASWVIENVVTQVSVKDNANAAGGGDRVLEITFASSGSFCGASSSTISIPQTGHALWSEWIKVATTAQVSGKALRVGSNDSTGSCKAHYLRIQN